MVVIFYSPQRGYYNVIHTKGSASKPLAYFFLSAADFFIKIFFFEKKNDFEIPSENQTVWIQIRLDVLFRFCKG